jgi:hypothetical protein
MSIYCNFRYQDWHLLVPHETTEYNTLYNESSIVLGLELSEFVQYTQLFLSICQQKKLAI